MRLPLLMVLCVIVLSLLVDAYIYCDCGGRMPWRKPRLGRYGRKRPMPVGAKIYAVSAVLCWCVLAVACALPRRGEASILPIMWILFSYMSVYAAKAVYVLVSLPARLPWRPAIRKCLRRIAVFVAFCVFAITWWGVLFGRRQIEVVPVEITSSRLPQAFDGFKIAQFSDAHVGTWGKDTKFISALVDSLNATGADMIVFTGDLVNRRAEEAEPFIQVLSRLHAPAGVYAVLGNHDYSEYMSWPDSASQLANRRKLRNLEKRAGWDLMLNEYRTIRRGSDSIRLIGVENWGEPPFHQYGDLRKAYPNANDDNFKILLSHNPEHWRRVVSKETNIDLTLAGHTHAMQITVGKRGQNWWSPAIFRYKLWGGLYPEEAIGDRPKLYVNIGSGEVGMPFRIGATPEITLFTLRRTQSD